MRLLAQELQPASRAEGMTMAAANMMTGIRAPAASMVMTEVRTLAARTTKAIPAARIRDLAAIPAPPAVRHRTRRRRIQGPVSQGR
ncbi:hypothetical protein ORS3428_02435 [Mesorhizobium sp. ORS 3428]|nr:hypothetical protein ORS3428_02435 [Mesorhizobium sp. ORS 3428]